MKLLKLPSPSIRLSINRMGSLYCLRMFEEADLQVARRLLRIKRLHTAAMIKRFKRLFCWGSLNPLLPLPNSGEQDTHTQYSEIPLRLRKHPKFCVLRDIRSWHISHYSFYLNYTRNRLADETLLAQSIRLLMLDDDSIGLNGEGRAFLLRHKEAFVDRFKGENLEGLGDRISLGSYFWHNNHLRPGLMMDGRYRQYPIAGKIGFLTFRAITILFRRPEKVFAMNREELEEYFASGKYRQDIDCTSFLRFDNLTDNLCSLMSDELGYHPDIVLSARETLEGKHIQRNQTPDKFKTQVAKKFDEEGVMPEILEAERIYQKYIYPLASNSGGQT